MWWLGLGLLFAAPAEHFQQTRWTTTDGLPQSSVNALAQAPDGTLVVGTYAGIVEFDGRTFDVLDESADTGWSGLRITALGHAPDAEVLAATQDGRLFRVHRREIVEVPLPRQLAGMPVWSIASGDDATWVVGEGGAAVFEADAWTTLPDLWAAATVVVDDQGAWIAGEHGLQTVRGGEVEDVEDVPRDVRALCESELGLVVAGDAGVHRVGRDGVAQLDAHPSARVLCASDGRIWASGDRELRVVDESGVALSFEHPIATIFEDRERNVWVGTDGGGLVRVTPEDWWLSEIPGGALPMVELEDGSLLVGGYCGEGGLFLLPTDAPIQEVSSACVRALAVDGQRLLVGSDEAVFEWSADEGLLPLFEVGERVLALTPTEHGVWVGTENGGAMLWHDGALEPVDVGDARVLAIVRADDGAMWFGTHWGLSRLAEGRLTRWTRDDGVPPGPIRSVRVDPLRGVLMASYGGGIGVLRDGEFRRLTVADGLPDNAVSSILDDGESALWINGNRGLSRLMLEDFDAWLEGSVVSPRLRRWNSPEGNGGGQPAGARLRDGRLAFPSTQGVVVVSPSDVFRNPVQPNVIVTAADVDGVTLDRTREVEVDPGPGRVHVEFTAATLRHPELATLEYRLVEAGSDEAGPWYVAPDGTAAWGGLAPGAHVVELRARNEDGVLSEVVWLRLLLAPHLHQRVSFWLAIAALVAAAGAAAHRWRTHAIEAKNRELEREVKQRAEAEEKNRRIAGRLAAGERLEAVGRLAGGIAHDFNNLLTAVSSTASVLRGQLPESSDSDGLLDELDRCVVRGSGLTRSLLAFARRQPMDPTAIEVGRQLVAMRRFLETSLRDDVELTIEIAEPVGVVVDPTLFELALMNLLLNAAKALPRGGHVSILVEHVDGEQAARRFQDAGPRPDGTWVVISVRDDGVGMTQEVLAKAREPFFTTRDDGHGLGLPSVDGFAVQSGGGMHIESYPGQGTSVSLVLPYVEPPAPAAEPSSEEDTAPCSARILLCDDDELVRQTVVRLLRRAGFETVSFADPTEVLAAADTADFDVLVTDMLMPGMSGDELARRLRARHPGLPVVFMSGYTDEIRTDDLPGRLLHKPFRARELVATVVEALGDQGEASRS